MRSILINAQERRLRAGWRLAIFGGLFFLILVLVSALAGILYSLASLAGASSLPQGEAARALSGQFAVLVSGAGGLIAMLVVLLVMRHIDRRPLVAYGFRFSRSWWLDFLFGLLLGALLMALIFAAERAAGWLTVTGPRVSFLAGQGFWQGIAISMILFLSVGIYEETMIRGYLLRNLAEGWNGRLLGARGALLLAYLLSSAVFGLLHAANPNASWISTFNIFLAGLFLGLGYVLTGELAIPIGLHITWNFFQGNVFGLPVSGSRTLASFLAVQQGGPPLWTGGAFGPEAGLIGLLAMALGALLTVAWVRWRHGALRLHTPLASYLPTRNPEPAATPDNAS